MRPCSRTIPGTQRGGGWTRGRDAFTSWISTERSRGPRATPRSSTTSSPSSRTSTSRWGGGIRDDDTIEGYLATGVRYVILGTRAVTTPGFVADACVEFPGHIIVGIDAREGRVAVDGWSKLTRFRADELARRVEECGVEAIIHTDIGRDGMLEGANVEATARLASELNVPVFASGGIRDLDDIRALCEAADAGLAGAVIGRALYEGTLDFAAATALASELGGETWGI